MRIYASAAYIFMILFITQIEHPSHATKVILSPVQVRTDDARTWKGDARMWRDDEDTTSRGKQIFYWEQLFLPGINLCKMLLILWIFKFFKNLLQANPVKHKKSRSSLDRAFATSNHVAATPAIHVNTNALPRHGKLLKQVRFKKLKSELTFLISNFYSLLIYLQFFQVYLYDNTGFLIT